MRHAGHSSLFTLPLFTFAIQTLATRLTPAAQRALRAGHPWIYAGGVAQVKGEGRAGDLAVVFDRRTDRFAAVGLYDPDSPIRIKVLHVGKPVRVDADFFAEVVRRAYALRAPLLATDTNAYRLLNGENDGTPGLIADVYAGVLVVKVYSLAWGPWLDTVVGALVRESGTGTVVLRLSRHVQRAEVLPEGWADGAVLRGALPDPEVIFREHGVALRANVVDGHKTGFFLDHRDNRRRVGAACAKTRHTAPATVLDVFSYAGGFAAHALVGGAREVTALDISKQALALAEANARLNLPDPPLRTIAGDAFGELATLGQSGRRFDIVVVDPPSFAKRAAEVEGALGAYRRLTRLAIPLVAPGGLLLLASCSARVPAEDFYALQLEELRRSGRGFTEVARTGHDVDHPVTFAEGAYLKSLYVRVK